MDSRWLRQIAIRPPKKPETITIFRHYSNLMKTCFPRPQLKLPDSRRNRVRTDMILFTRSGPCIKASFRHIPRCLAAQSKNYADFVRLIKTAYRVMWQVPKPFVTLFIRTYPFRIASMNIFIHLRNIFLSQCIIIL